MNIGGLEFGPDQPTRLVVDISGAHNGDLDRAQVLISEAVAAGADVIKLRLFSSRMLAALRRRQFDTNAETVQYSQDLHALHTPPTWLRTLARHCESVAVPWIASVYDPYMFTTLESFGCYGYRLASRDYGLVDALRDRILDSGKPCLQSTPLRAPPDDGTYPIYSPLERVHTSDPTSRLSGGYKGLSYQGRDTTLVRTAATSAELIEVQAQRTTEPASVDSDISFTIAELTGLSVQVRQTRPVAADNGR